MPEVMHFYVDDSGTRHPDHHPGRTPAHGHDWFALGGVILKQDDEARIRAAHKAFCNAWGISSPLRSADIRSRAGNFAWLGTVGTEKREAFLEELYRLMAEHPILGHGCVIDRPGYNARYLPRYGRQRWLLCKTAFSVVVERAAKFALRHGCKLKVFVERSDRKTDRRVAQYYEDLRASGMPFDTRTSDRYAPLDAATLAGTLYEFRTKKKTSPIMQLADLYLWPICMGGYDAANRTFVRLRQDRRLIDNVLDPGDLTALGIKYSCWELAAKRTTNNS